MAFDRVSPRLVYELLLEWRKAGKFTGGLDLYRSSGFVHTDHPPLGMAPSGLIRDKFSYGAAFKERPRRLRSAIDKAGR